MLLAAYAKHGPQWIKIATEVGHGKTDRHCYKRWKNYLNPNVDSRKYKPWSALEVRAFCYCC